MNDSRQTETLLIEGAGLAEADSSKEHAKWGLSNCRLRTSFINDSGESIYLELGAYANKNPYGKTQAKIAHCFLMEEGCNGKKYREFERGSQFCFNKAELLEFINKDMGAAFKDIIVVNDNSYSAFESFGIYKDDKQ